MNSQLDDDTGQVPRLGVEDLMKNVRATVSRRSDASSSDKASVEKPGSEREGRDAVRSPRLLVIKPRYCLAELLAHEGDAFLHHAYLCLLGRACDQQGQEHYQKALKAGVLNKIEILGRLRYGPEGRKHHVHVSGLLSVFLWQSLKRAVRSLGSIA